MTLDQAKIKYGESRQSLTQGDHIIIVTSRTSYLAESTAPVNPVSEITLFRVTAIDAPKIQLKPICTYGSNGDPCPSIDPVVTEELNDILARVISSIDSRLEDDAKFWKDY